MEKEHHVPARDLLLGYRIVTNTSDVGLFATLAAGQLLVASVLAKATAVACAHVAEVAALTDLGPSSRSPVRSAAGSSWAGEARAGRSSILLVARGRGRAGGACRMERGWRVLVQRGLAEPFCRVHLRRRRCVCGHLPSWRNLFLAGRAALRGSRAWWGGGCGRKRSA